MKRLLPLFALLALALIASTTTAQSWFRSPVNGHLYALTTFQTSWTHASSMAVAQGGHLATIRNQAEQDWIVKTFAGRDLWIGLNDIAVEGQWRWASGETSTYRNWCPGDPNNGLGAEDCAYIVSGPPCTGQWNDNPDTFIKLGLIEIHKPAPAATLTPLGPGCPGSTNSTAALSTKTGPVLGQTLVLQLTGTRPFAPCFLLLGFTPLQLSLAPFGAPGCSVYANPHIVLFAATDGSGAWWPDLQLPIPSDPNFAGLALDLQVVVHDPYANYLDTVTSNGIRARLGY